MQPDVPLPARRCAVITVSDTLDEESDRGGSLLTGRLERGGHEVELVQVIPHRPEKLDHLVDLLAERVDLLCFHLDGPFDARSRFFGALADQWQVPVPGFAPIAYQALRQAVGGEALTVHAAAGMRGDLTIAVLSGSLPALRCLTDQALLPLLRERARAEATR